MEKQIGRFSVMEDCVHLKACRRIQKIGKSRWLNIPRYCTEDCSAYLSGNIGGFLTENEAYNEAEWQTRGCVDSSGYSFCFSFPSRTLQEIMEEAEAQ